MNTNDKNRGTLIVLVWESLLIIIIIIYLTTLKWIFGCF